MHNLEQLREFFTYDPVVGVFVSIKERKRAYVGKVLGVTDANGYTHIVLEGVHYYAHRLAWLFMTGAWPKEYIDHANGDKADNRWENLRAATGRLNGANRRLRADNRAGLKGVYQRSPNSWVARIRADGGKQRHIGCFPTREEAHEAYMRAAKEAFGEFARAA